MLFGILILISVILSLIGMYVFIVMDTYKQRRLLKKRKMLLINLKKYRRLLGKKN